MRKIFALLFMFVISTCYLYAQDADVNLNYKGHIAVPIFTEHPLVTTASWTSLPPTPHGQSRTACTYIEVGGTAYIYQFGGGSGSLYKNVARFNFTTNSWTNNVSTMPMDMSSATAITIPGDSLIYVFGGNTSTTGLGKTLKWNVITNTWTVMAPMTTLVTDAAVVLYNDSLVYVIGGGTGLFGSGYKNTVQVYHLNTNTYTSGGTYPIIAGMQGVGIYGDTIICAGGWTGSGGTPNAYKGIINPATLQVTWTPIPNYPTGGVTRMGSFFVVKGTGGGVVFTGGAIGGATVTSATNFWNFCTQTWQTGLPNNSTAASNFKGCGAGDSIMYIVAGYPTTTRFEKITFSQIDGNCMGPSVTVPEVLYYTFDETGRDSTKNYAIPGRGAPWATVLGQTIGGTGQWGNALVGTGGSSSSNYVNTGWTTDIGTSSWTISLWLSNITTTFGYYFGDNTANSWRCFLNGAAGTNNITLRGGGMSNLIVSGVVPGPTVVTFVYDSAAGQTRGYKNGVLDATVTQAPLNINGTAPYKVGGYSTSAGLLGKLDEFRLYDRALTDAEVAASWNHQFIISGIKPVLNIIPEDYVLSQNYPNPFNPTTTIDFKVPVNGLVILKVYDVTGKEVKTLVNEVVNAGVYTVDFNASDLSSGVYFYKIVAGDFMNVKKMVLLK